MPIPGSLLGEVHDLADRCGTTPFVVGLTLFSAFLMRLNGQTDLTIGLPVTLRSRPELQTVVGLLLNTVVLRLKLDVSQDFVSKIGTVKRAWEESMPYHEVPLDHVVQAAGSRERSLFDAMFVYLQPGAERTSFAGLACEKVESIEGARAKFPLTMTLGGHDGGLSGDLFVDTNVFGAESVEALSDALGIFIESALNAPEVPVGTLETRSSDTNSEVEDWRTGTRVDNPALTSIEQLEAAVVRGPDRTALVFDGGVWTYAELNARANRIAHHLIPSGGRNRGARRDQL